MEFYDSRPHLGQARGTLEQELSRVERGWVSWTAFQSAPQVNASLLRNIERMILRDPESPDLSTIAELSGLSVAHLQESIRTAVSISERQGVAIKLSRSPVPDLIISNAPNGDAWIRVEPWIPRMQARNRPSFIVRESERNVLFRAIREAYEKLWDSLESGKR